MRYTCVYLSNEIFIVILAPTVFFVIKLINDLIDSPTLLGEIDFSVPNRFPGHQVHFANVGMITFKLFKPFEVLSNGLNNIYKLISIFDSLNSPEKGDVPNFMGCVDSNFEFSFFVMSNTAILLFHFCC